MSQYKIPMFLNQVSWVFNDEKTEKEIIKTNIRYENYHNKFFIRNKN